MTDFALPHSVEELRNYLRGELARWEQKAQEAESFLARQRLAVFEEFELPLLRQSQRLQALGLHDEARQALQLIDAVRSEAQRISGRLSVVPTPATTGAADEGVGELESFPSSAHEPQPEPCVPESSTPPGSPLTCDIAAQPAPEDVCSAISENPRAAVDELFREMEMLSAAAPEMDHEELKLRIEVLGARGRLLQEDYPQLRGQNTQMGDRLHCTFGGLTALAKRHLNPVRIFVESVNQNKSRQWAKFLERSEGDLQELLDRRKASQTREAEQELAQRRRKQAEDENARQAAQAREDVLDLLEAPGDAQDSYWQEDLRDAVREYHRWSPNQTDDQLLSALRAHPDLFKAGGEFRWLRKKLSPKASESGSFEPVELLPGQGRQTVQTNTRAFDQWRGYLEGKRAAIVGASRRENRREQLQKFFALSSLEWIENERTEAANTHTLDQRIRNGRYHIVFYLARFSSHSLQDCAKSACKQSDVPFIVIERGYGIGAFCRAIERARGLLPIDGPAA